MELSKFIGQKIRNFREQRGLSVEQLADKLDTTRATVTRYELGSRKANQDVLFKLAEIFNVNVDDFFPTREKKPSNIIYPKEGLEVVSIPIIGEIACDDLRYIPRNWLLTSHTLLATFGSILMNSQAKYIYCSYRDLPSVPSSHMVAHNHL